MHQRPTDAAPLPHGVHGQTVDHEDVLMRRHRAGLVQAYVTKDAPTVLSHQDVTDGSVVVEEGRGGVRSGTG